MGDVEFPIDNGLLKQHQVNDSHAVGEACLAALEQWTGVVVHGPGIRAKPLG